MTFRSSKARWPGLTWQRWLEGRGAVGAREGLQDEEGDSGMGEDGQPEVRLRGENRRMERRSRRRRRRRWWRAGEGESCLWAITSLRFVTKSGINILNFINFFAQRSFLPWRTPSVGSHSVNRWWWTVTATNMEVDSPWLNLQDRLDSDHYHENPT